MLDSLGMYTHTKSVGAQLHEFVICASSEVDNERRELMLKLVQFTGMPFPDLNPNSYTFDNLNNMKLDLNISKS